VAPSVTLTRSPSVTWVMSSAADGIARKSGAPGASGASRLPAWQPWSALALFSSLLHFVWEMLSVPFYSGIGERSHAAGVRFCFVASLGDVAIALLAYGVVAALRTRRWVMTPDAGSRIGFVIVGVGITAVFEYVNVYCLTRWSYAPAMPLLAGIGVVPIAQWIVLPLITLWLTRRHLAGATSFAPPSETTT
jgi:hypothetical protein